MSKKKALAVRDDNECSGNKETKNLEKTNKTTTAQLNNRSGNKF